MSKTKIQRGTGYAICSVEFEKSDAIDAARYTVHAIPQYDILESPHA